MKWEARDRDVDRIVVDTKGYRLRRRHQILAESEKITVLFAQMQPDPLS